MKEALAHLLYTIRDRTKAVPKKILKEQIFCLAAALFLTVITYLSAMNSSNLIGGVHLLRDRHGGLKRITKFLSLACLTRRYLSISR